MQPAKGEAFEIKIKSFDTEQILRDEIFLVPQNNGSFWSGGGYQWKFENAEPTTEFKNQWKEKLDHLLKVDYDILNHKAGIRPSVKGRRPLLGKHHQYPHLVLFNGLGTKGSSLGPYFANHLCDHLFEGEELMPEVDIYRFRNVS